MPRRKPRGCPLDKLKTYSLYIKSHTEAPDFEATIKAKNKEEAIKKFLKDPALRDWDESMIKNQILEENEENQRSNKQ